MLFYHILELFSTIFLTIDKTKEPRIRSSLFYTFSLNDWLHLLLKTFYDAALQTSSKANFPAFKEFTIDSTLFSVKTLVG